MNFKILITLMLTTISATATARDLSNFPVLGPALVELLAWPMTSPEVRAVLDEILADESVAFQRLTPELRASLNLDSRWSGGTFFMDLAKVIPDPDKPRGANSQLDHLNLSALDPTRVNLVAPDGLDIVNHFDRSPIGNLAWAIQVFGHEAAHSWMRLVLDDRAPILITDPSFGDGFLKFKDHRYFMDPHVYDFLHEQFASRIGYKAMLDYLMMKAKYPIQKILFPETGELVVTPESISQLETMIPARVYGAEVPEKWGGVTLLNGILAQYREARKASQCKSSFTSQ